MKKLEAKELPLIKVFSDDYEFFIPDYQRPYGWGETQVTDLLGDLTSAMNAGDDEPYFLGSLVLVQEANERRAQVIDGQQRLTTLTLLLAVLRLLITDPAFRPSIDQLITAPGMVAIGQKGAERLTLRQRDRKFFRQYVQDFGGLQKLLVMQDPGTGARTALWSNAKLLRDELAVRSQQQLKDLLAFVLKDTFLVVVKTPDLDSAYRIFSVMNSRGLDLSPADIFKANVIGKLDSSERPSYAQIWEAAEEALGREDFTDLFLHIRMIFAKARAPHGLLKMFPKQVLNKYSPEKFIDDVLKPYADAYQDIREESYSAPIGAGAVNAWLRCLNRLDNNDWKPVALWALRHHGDDPDYLQLLFRRLERVAASLLLSRAYTTPRAQRYADILNQLEKDPDPHHASGFDLSAAEKIDMINVLNGDIFLSKPVRKYVLLRLDELLANAPGVTYQHRIITVEHVLPQDPNPLSQWATVFSKGERSQWTHKLGNLVLLNRSKNSQAQNYDFTRKKQLYFTSPTGVASFALTSQVLAVSTWTPDTLAQRQSELVGRLKKQWDL